MTDSNRLQLACVREATFGTTPPTPRMRTARLTGESLAFTPTFIQPDEMRSDRMNSDPVKINEQNSGPINWQFSYPEADSPFSDFIRSNMYSDWVNSSTRDNDGAADSVITDIGTTTDTVACTTGAAFVAGHLVRFSGNTNPANDGVRKCTTGSATAPVFASSGFVADTAPAAAAKMKAVGFQGASGDITATATGLGSTALNFTTLGLAVGMWVKIGGTAAGDKFATAALNDWMRITAITATALTLDNRPSGWTTDAGTSKTIKVWSGDYIKNGTTRTSLSIERGFLGQTTPTYILQKGMIAGQGDYNFSTEQIISGSFTFEGLSGSQSTSAQDASPDAATTNRVMSANVNVGRIADGGASISGNFVRACTVMANNNLRPITAVGSVGRVGIGAGEFMVEGTLESYFQDNALLTKLLASTTSSINLRAVIDSQAVIWDVPNVTFTGGSPSAGGKNQDVMLPLNWRAAYSSTHAAALLINRLPYYE